MGAVAGPPRRVSIDGRSFSVAGDANPGRNIGGWQVSEVEPNTDLTVRVVSQVVPWMYDGISLAIDDSSDDLEFLKDVQERNAAGELVGIAVTEASNITYRGPGAIVGEVKREGDKATAPLTFKGQGKISK